MRKKPSHKRQRIRRI